MKKYLYFFCLLFCMLKLHADDVVINELKFSNNYTHKQQAFLHTIPTDRLLGINNLCEFTIEDTLYIVSSIFDQDYSEFKEEIPNVPTLVDKMMSIYYEKGDCDNCGFVIDINTLTPATLTLYSHLDTIQYTITPSPDLFAACICDTIYGSFNLKCGFSVQQLFNKLSSFTLHYNFSKYDNIVLIPQEFEYLSYQQNGYLILPDICFLLKIRDGVIIKIEVRQFNFSGRRLIDDVMFL